MNNFTNLQNTLTTLDNQFKIEAGKSVNQLMTIRNWLIGYYIVEFQQNGEDRAEYGAKLFTRLEKSINARGFSAKNLRLFRQFYSSYPQLQPVIKNFLVKSPIWQSVTAKLQVPDKQSITLEELLVNQSVSTPPEKIISRLSFTHLVEIMTFDDPLQRTFYEIESIKGGWTVQVLKRQIKTMLFERTGLSADKADIIRRANEKTKPPQPSDYFRSSYIFEFLELPEPHQYQESDLEQALIDHLQLFLIELGNGFCFEARQKRVLIGDEWHFIDLLFYHRILKCHVIVDLKIERFKLGFAGNMNGYVNYFKDEVQQESDNSPIGLLLCTDRNEAAVQYAFGGMDESVFVSRYKMLLPDEAVLKGFLEREMNLLG